MGDKPTEGKKPQVTRREHWLPRSSHLAEFAVDEKLQVYRFQDGQKVDFTKTSRHFETGIEGVGLENDLYESPRKPTNAVEKALAQIESDYGKVLDSKIKKQQPLTDLEHQQVAYYIAALEARTPAKREHLDEFLRRVDGMGRQIALAHNAPDAAGRFTSEVNEARQELFTDSIGISLEINNLEPLDFCFLIVDDMFKEMDFVTGDHPVSVVDFTSDNSFYGLHPLSKTAETVVPLTPRIALFGNRAGITGYRTVDANFIREINNRTLPASKQMLIAARPFSDREADAIVRRRPQSILLRELPMPNGRMDRMLEEIKAKEGRR
jgi:uncharacterized protein DUF4238